MTISSGFGCQFQLMFRYNSQIRNSILQRSRWKLKYQLHYQILCCYCYFQELILQFSFIKCLLLILNNCLRFLIHSYPQIPYLSFQISTLPLSSQALQKYELQRILIHSIYQQGHFSLFGQPQSLHHALYATPARFPSPVYQKTKKPPSLTAMLLGNEISPRTVSLNGIEMIHHSQMISFQVLEDQIYDSYGIPDERIPYRGFEKILCTLVASRQVQLLDLDEEGMLTRFMFA